MKRLQLLKLIAGIVFTLMCITLFFAYPFIFIVAVMPQQVPFTIGGIPANELDAEHIFMMLAFAVSFSFYTYALYLFKNLLGMFLKKKIFHTDVIKNLLQTGKAILIGYLIYICSGIIYVIIAKSYIGFEISGYTLLIPMLGLFFMVLGDVLLTAKTMKENDLSV
ncbi:DUF2975 domain-containing protein [Flavobacterium rhizosphaerae]|uniref:DUF2975 domain-containing protein n=1 Tax=Flavobacterium rhizosphaerae TaxID=3163298 RepID=A0ABW8YSH2_9FLAO